MNSALGIYAAQGGTGFGSSSIVYVSIPDPTATSTSGDQCQGLGLPTAPSGTSYFCEASSSYRNVNGTGWIPINFSTLSAGSPLGSLPQDPTNTTTTGNYYTYATNGTQFIVTAIPESVKTKSNLAINPQIPDYPEVMAQGSNLTISPLWSPTGLVGYWNFEEGSGTTAFDTSGNQNNGTWSGITPYYAGGKVGGYAGNFDGTSDSISASTTSNFNFGTGSFTVNAWIKPNAGLGSYYQILGKKLGYNGNNIGWQFWLDMRGGSTGEGPALRINDGSAYSDILASTPSDTRAFFNGSWVDVSCVVNIGNNATFYINGTNYGTEGISGMTGSISNSQPVVFGMSPSSASGFFPGSIDDVRVYNRALSAAEIQALYSAEK